MSWLSRTSTTRWSARRPRCARSARRCDGGGELTVRDLAARHNLDSDALVAFAEAAGELLGERPLSTASARRAGMLAAAGEVWENELGPLLSSAQVRALLGRRVAPARRRAAARPAPDRPARPGRPPPLPGRAVHRRAPAGAARRRVLDARRRRREPVDGRVVARRARTTRSTAGRPWSGCANAATRSGSRWSRAATPPAWPSEPGRVPAAHAARRPRALPHPPSRPRPVVVLHGRQRPLRPDRHRPRRVLLRGPADRGVRRGVPQAHAAARGRADRPRAAHGRARPQTCDSPT